MKAIDPKALFRLSVLGPLVSRERLARGELQQIVRELAQREYDIPGSRRRHLGEKTIEGWFYAYRRQGIEGRSEEHTSELQSLMRISYAVFCLNKKKNDTQT